MYLSKSNVRLANVKSILNYIYTNQPISRAEISVQTGLNKASVSEITRELINKKFILETGSGNSTDVGGRRPILLEFNHKFGTVIGIDIGVNSIRYRQCYLNGDLITKDKKSSDKVNLYNQIFEILTEINKNKKKVLACTISVQGTTFDNKIIFTPNYNVLDLENLNNHFSFPILLENEANLAAFAHSFEYSESNSASITLRTGVGSGIIFDHQIYYGFSGAAGELGHTIVYPNGRDCICGNKGCLEQYISEKALINDYKKIKNLSNASVKNIADDFHNGDSETIDLITNFTDVLAIGINNFFLLYDIPKMYLVSNISSIIPDISNIITSKITNVFIQNIEIIDSPFSKDASAYGACLFSINYFLDNCDKY
ncbi:ROK family transcriptional regulator [Erysipelothrix urinaevulpis]|uniref:ROK family transcriptional regulator n=1 Tax=Erysipelothrix urinaevulpis TaxID=2683717 RepID=UPI00135AF5CB|nr:ROK family transcriptional regulator [Erysipelothrix urinaevulpis]